MHERMDGGMAYRTGGYGAMSFGVGFGPTPVVKRLLIANVVVFFLMLVVA